MSEMVEVTIDSVRVSLMSPQRLVVLRQVDEDRYLPIWVGPYEAESITVALQEIEMIRPLTHDLLKNVFTIFHAEITRVEIVSLRQDIFYGNIVVQVGAKVLNLDSRPSDAIALAIRARAPILVDAEVMQNAAITPEEDLRNKNATSPTRLSEPPASQTFAAPSDKNEDPGRLSIFEDFLSKLEKKGGDENSEAPHQN